MVTATRSGASQELQRDRGRRVFATLKVVSIMALAIALYGGVAVDLFQDWWTQPSLSYGLLIPPLAIYAAWIKRKEILAIPTVQDPRGIVLVGVASLMYLTGKLGAEFFLQRLSMVVLLTALIWTFWGSRRLTALAFPLVLLAAAIPLPVIVYNLLAAPLQLFASNVASDIARFAGVTVFRDGNVLQLAATTLGVEEACSGLNSLSALVVGALLLGNLECQWLWAKVLVFVSAVPIALGVNVLRVAGTAVLADIRPEWAMGFYHSFEGWMVFVLGFAALYGVARLISLVTPRKAEQL